MVNLNHVDEVFSFTAQVIFYGARFPGGKEGICSKSLRNVGTSSTVFAATERTKRKFDERIYCSPKHHCVVASLADVHLWKGLVFSISSLACDAMEPLPALVR